MQLGFVGLGKMGLNMVTRLEQGGHQVVAFDRSGDAVEHAKSAGAGGAASLETLVSTLTAPRAVWVMVPSGDADGIDGRGARHSPRVRRRHHRRRQHQLPRRRATRRGVGQKKVFITSTPAQAAASGG